MDADSITGEYTFKPDHYFYQGHFKNTPVTPGVILIECMAQIGVVCLGIYLLDNEENLEASPSLALSSTETEFLRPVLPGEKVSVDSEKIYFRFNKLKCKVKMFNSRGEMVCHGIISGMMLKSLNDNE